MLWRFIWNLSEFSGIGLGRFAPFVFGKMIGKRGHKVPGKNSRNGKSKTCILCGEKGCNSINLMQVFLCDPCFFKYQNEAELGLPLGERAILLAIIKRRKEVYHG